MSKKKKVIEDKITCVAYLSTAGDILSAEKREEKQLKYIMEYAKAHNIEIIRVMHRDVLGQAEMNKHFNLMVDMIKCGKVQGIILSNMMAISTNIPDAYFKVGKVRDAGGCVLTVDEGNLFMRIKEI